MCVRLHVTVTPVSGKRRCAQRLDAVLEQPHALGAVGHGRERDQSGRNAPVWRNVSTPFASPWFQLLLQSCFRRMWRRGVRRPSDPQVF